MRLVVLMISMTGVLLLFSSNFDLTELKSIVTMFLLASGSEAASQLIPKLQAKDE